MAEQIGLEAILVTDQFNKGVKQYNSGLSKMSKNTKSTASVISGQMAGAGKSVLKVGAIAGGAALVGIAAFGAGMAALGVASVTTAISFESAFAGVIKTTEGLTDSVGGLTTAGEELRQGFVNLSKEVPLAFEELAAIGELGGQLGIGKDALLDFTETVAGLGVATNLSTEEAATGLARMSNIYNIASEDMGANIERLGSTIVALGNNFATTERDILSFGERIAGAGAIAGLAQSEVLAIGAAMSSVGVEAEAGGTAVQKVLLGINNAVNSTATGFVDYTKQIDTNVEKLTDLNAESARLEAIHPGLQAEMLATREAFLAAGGSAEDFGRQLGDTTRQGALETAMAIQDLTAETNLMRAQQGQPIDAGALQQFASVAGLSADEFTEAWETDAAGAFQLFVEGLAAEGDNAVNVLNDLGMADQRLIRSFLSLAGAGDLLGNAIELGNEAFEDNTALAKEAAQRYATTESQIAILKNTFRAIGDQIGSRFLPYLNELIALGKDLVDKWAGPITDAIENNVIPAIENIIGLAGQLFAAFQTGGTAGLAAALGLTPETSELINKIVGSISALGLTISGVLMPGITELSSGGLLDIINTSIIFLNENFEALSGAILGIGAVLAAGVFAALVAAVMTLLSPINLIIAAAALLGAAWAGNWGNIQGITEQVITTIQAILGALVETFNAVILPQLNAAFVTLTEALTSMGLNWGDVWNAIVLAVQIVATAIGVAILGIITVFTGFVTGLATMVAVATGYLVELGANFQTFLEGLAMQWAGIIQIFTAGTWEEAWNGIVLVAQGMATSLGAVLEGIVTIFTGFFASIIGFVAGFAQGVIDIFTNLSNVLVGNSIVPDMVEGIIGWFTTLVSSVTSVLGGLGELVSGIFAGLFGGGETEGPGIDLSGMTAGLAEIGPAIELVQQQFMVLGEVAASIIMTLIGQLILITNQVLMFDLGIQNIYLVTLPTLLAIFTTTTQAMIQMLIQVMQSVLQLDQTIQNIYLTTLPTLQSITMTTAQIMIAAFMSVVPSLAALVALVAELTSNLEAAQAAAEAMADALIDGFKESSDAIREFIELVDAAEVAVRKLADAIGAAARGSEAVAGAIKGLGLGPGGEFAGQGIGFKHGSPGFNTGLGWSVPAGYPNDTFPLRVTSGEEVLVTPPGTSIDSVIGRRLASMGAGGTTKIVEINIPSVVINNGTDYNVLIETIRQTVAGQI